MGLKSDLQEKFNWHLLNKFSIAQQKVILAAGQALLLFLDQQTAGRGKAWMARNIGKVNFYRGGLPHKVVTLANHGTPTSVTFLKRTIWLEPTFEQSANPIQHVIHEVAHVIDNVAGSHEHALLSIWFGHGPSDHIVDFANVADRIFSGDGLHCHGPHGRYQAVSAIAPARGSIVAHLNGCAGNG